jgi:hypothetical protein
MAKRTVIAAAAQPGISQRLDIFGLGIDNQMFTRFWDGQSWPTAWSPPNSGVWRFLSAPAVTSWGGNRLDLFALDVTNALWHVIWDGQWRPWEALGGGFAALPAVATSGENHIFVVGLGFDNALYRGWWDGANWHVWHQTPSNVKFSGSPAAAGTLNGARVDVVARDSDNNMWHIAFGDDGQSLFGWQPLGGGSFASAPSMVTWGNGRLDVFVLGANNQMLHQTYDDNSWNQSWEDLGGTFASPPAVISWGPGRLDVFALGGDNQMYHRGYDGGWLGPWESLGGVFNSPPAAAARAADRLDVFGLGTDNNVYHASWDGQWHLWEALGGVFTNP